MSNFAGYREIGPSALRQCSGSSKISCREQDFTVTGWYLKQGSGHGWGTPVPCAVSQLPWCQPRAETQHSDSCSHGSLSLALFSKLCSVLWLISLSFVKYMKYSWIYQVSHLTHGFMFWCYKNRAVPHQQKVMHWQLRIKMFQHFIPREIHEDCLFTSTQNNISVLKVKISHKVEF